MKATAFSISALVLAFATESWAFPFWVPSHPGRKSHDQYCIVHEPFMLPSGKFTEGVYFVKEGTMASYCSKRIREQDIPRYKEANRRMLEHLVAMNICRMRKDYSLCPVDPELEIKNLQRMEQLWEQKRKYPQYWR